MSDVYFAEAGATKSKDGLLNKLRLLAHESGVTGIVNKGDTVAVKTHMGDSGNTTHIHPAIIRRVVDMVKEAGGKPFVTDTTVLYGRRRFTELGYLEVASENGFNPESMGCPIVIADGMNGMDGMRVEGDWNVLKGVEVASAIHSADAMIVVSHPTGHARAGFGGALKNMAMGCVTKRGKIVQHSVLRPSFDESKCTLCGDCIDVCPSRAILLERETGNIDFDVDVCFGCEICVFSCKQKAWVSNVDMIPEFQIRVADSAAGVMAAFDPGKVSFVNIALNITWHCDCTDFSDRPVVPDIGLLASMDPLSIDQASSDLIVESPGVRGSMAERVDALNPGVDKLSRINHVDAEVQFKTAERLGMWQRRYNLLRI